MNDLEITSELSLSEVVTRASARFYPGGISTGPARNAVIRSWAGMVGRDRAISDLQRLVSIHGSRTAAARAMRMSKRTLDELEAFFASLHAPMNSPPSGLSLYIGTPLMTLDRFAIEGLMLALLGQDTDCRIVDYQERGDWSFLRVDGSSPEALHRLGAAIWNYAWETQESQSLRQNSLLARVLESDMVKVSLSRTRKQLQYMECHTLSEAAVEMLNDQGEQHVQRKDKATVQTWGQKSAKRVFEASKQRALKSMPAEIGALLGNDEE